MILRFYRHGASLPLRHACVKHDSVAIRKRFLSNAGHYHSSDDHQNVHQRKTTKRRGSKDEHDSITELGEQTETHHDRQQPPPGFSGSAPTLDELNHQVELHNPSDILRRRFFGPYALIRSRAINERLASNSHVRSLLTKQAKRETLDSTQALSNDERGRVAAERLAMHCARDLLDAQSRGAVEPGDMERIIGVAGSSPALTWLLASPRLRSRITDAKHRLEQMEKLRLMRIYTAFLQRENGSVYPHVIWQSVLTSAGALNTNAMAHYLRQWHDHIQGTPKAHSEARSKELLQVLHKGLKRAPEKANKDDAALMTVLLGSAKSPNSTIESTLDTSIRALLYRTRLLNFMPYNIYISILQNLGAKSVVENEYTNWFASNNFAAPDKPHSKPVKPPRKSPYDTPAYFMRAFFALDAPAKAWEIWRTSGFSAGEGSKIFDNLLLSHQSTRPDFLSGKDWKLSDTEKATLDRRLAAQKSIVEERLCEQLLGQLTKIEDAMMVKWAPSEEEGLAPGYHVFDEDAVVDEDEDLESPKDVRVARQQKAVRKQVVDDELDDVGFDETGQ